MKKNHAFSQIVLATALLCASWFVTGANVARAGIQIHQSSQGYTAPGTMTVHCEVEIAGGPQLLSLLWSPDFPEHWDITDVTAPTDATVSERQILFEGDALPVGSFDFHFTFTVPEAMVGPVIIGGSYEFQFLDMSNPETRDAVPPFMEVRSFKELTVVSAHGQPEDFQPLIGTHTHTHGDNINPMVLIPSITTGGTQLVCSGWAMVGNDPTEGAEFSFSMVITNDAVLTWLWSTNYYLDIGVTGDTGGYVEPDSDWYPAGEPLTLHAHPDTGYRFAGWTGDVTSDDPEVLISMDRSYTVRAVFEEKPTLQVNSPYGSPEPPDGIHLYSAGATVEARMDDSPWQIDAEVRKVCTGWEGTGSVDPVTGEALELSFVINEHSTLNWLWKTQFLLTIQEASNGSVADLGGWYDEGHTVELEALPDEGYRFLHWEGSVGGTDNPIAVNMTAANTVRAIFEPIFHIIDATRGAGGTIAPVGAISVRHGNSTNFVITPHTGYHIFDVLVDGASMGPMSEYTFENVQTNHTIHVDFSETDVTLHIFSLYGTTYPPTGVHQRTIGMPVAAYLTESMVFDGTKTQYVSVGWAGTGSAPESGTGTNVNFMIEEASSVTWLWTTNVYLGVGVVGGGGTVSGDPPGWKPLGADIEVLAEAHPGFLFREWEGDVNPDQAGDNPIALTMNRARTLQARFKPDGDVFHAEHESYGYHAPGSAMIEGSFRYADGEQLADMAWQPLLPADWTLEQVWGDAGAYISEGVIRFHDLTAAPNPISLTYEVGVPPLPLSMLSNQIGGVIEFRLDGMPDPMSVPVMPDPLAIERFHTADYREPFWTIDNTEINRVLAYWRAGGYRPSTIGFDGFAPTDAPDPDDRPELRHSADYEEPHREINAAEASTALALWRADGYHVDATAPGGYATGRRSRRTRTGPALPAPAVSLEVPDYYQPGHVLEMRVHMHLASGWLGMCWIPDLPEGWVVQDVQGDGQPEVRRNEVLWTGHIPAGDLSITCHVAVPPDAEGPVWLDGTLILHAPRRAAPVRCQPDTRIIRRYTGKEEQPPAGEAPRQPRITSLRFESPGHLLMGWEGAEGTYRLRHSERVQDSGRRGGQVIREQSATRAAEKGAKIDISGQESGFFWLEWEAP